MRFNLGRLLISLAALITGVAPILADWNETHIFSRRWSPHARFHGVTALLMTGVLSMVALVLAWRRSAEHEAEMAVAAIIPIAYWGPFFVAPLVPGTAVEDRGHDVPRIAGVPTNLLGAGVTVISAALGWSLDRRWHRQQGRRASGQLPVRQAGEAGVGQMARASDVIPPRT